MRQWKVIGRHNHWVAGAKITETLRLDNPDIRRFTATIDGWRNFRILQGNVTGIGMQKLVDLVVKEVRDIKGRIRAGDESVFTEPGAW